MNFEIIIRILLMILVPFTFVVSIIPYIKKMAEQANAIDIPRNRHIHLVNTPKFGGIAIFFGFLLGYMLFGTHSSTMNAVLIGSFLIIFTGMLDDICELSPIQQFVGQISAALVISLYGNLLIQDINIFGLYINFGWLSYIITVFFIVGCINCINLIDGLDGLSGGISSIYFLTVGLIATIQGKAGLDFLLTFVMLGSTLGFLVYNFHPATIFAGNSGSNFLGFIISVIALLGFKNVTFTSLIIPLLILAIPILDTLFAILRRLIKKQNIVSADSAHIHHQLLNRNISQGKAVFIIYIIDILFACTSIVYVLKNETLGLILFFLLSIIVLYVVLKTNIIFDNDTKNKFKNKIQRTHK